MKTGVLLINTGTPDAPTKDAIRPYLTEFLMDPAIIGAPLFIRRPLVKHIVKNRPERTVTNYEAFWTPEGSPFMCMSQQQCAVLAKRLNEQAPAGERYVCALSMRYGNPSIRVGLERLRDEGCERVVLLPLYPQNVNVCAGTCLREAHRRLQEFAASGWTPEVAEVRSFHDHPAYRAALVEAVRACWSYTPGSKLIVSFHSTMMRDIKQDDTYLRQATETKDWLAEALGVPSEDAILGFQSRFDSRKWLQPFTEQILRDFIAQGVTDVCLITPGFVADNIETSIEVNRDLRRLFEQGENPTTQVMGHVVKWDPQNQSAEQVKGAEASEGTNGGEDTNGSEGTKDTKGVAGIPQRHFTYVPALGCADGLIETLVDCVRKA